MLFPAFTNRLRPAGVCCCLQFSQRLWINERSMPISSKMSQPIDEVAIRLLLPALIVALSGSARAAVPVDYTREVKPIFAEHCYRCHGGSQQKSDLRIDTAAAALKGGKNGPAFKPGKSAESLMMQVLKGTLADIAQMPYKKPPLSEAQIALIEKWIDQGANAPADEKAEPVKHWAFIAPVRTDPPEVKPREAGSEPASRGPRNAIDRFILARLEK